MSSKINILQIVADHAATLRNERTGKLSPLDMLCFVAFPLVLALIFYVFGWKLSDNTANLIVTGMSIFAGLMINVLVLIYTVALNTKTENVTLEESSVEKRFLCQIFSNISFSITVSVFIVVVVGGSIFVGPRAQEALSAVSVFLLGNFLLTLLMILKRLHILLARRFS